MANEMESKLHESIIVEAARLYGVERSAVLEVGGFESYVFEFVRDDQAYILKIIEKAHRTKEMLLAEVDYIQYLDKHGLSVSRPCTSVQEQYVEEIEDFYTISYEKAKGRKVTQEDWTTPLFIQLGEMVGRMHKLAEAYQPSHPSYIRPQWHEDPRMNHFPELLMDQQAIIEYGHKVWEEIHSYPILSSNYGLIHYDCHRGNYFVDNGRITLFDFDDLEHNWYVNDLAVILYYAIKWSEVEQGPEEIRAFVQSFLEGYQKHRSFEQEELERIPTFLKLRHFILYIALIEKQEEGEMTERRLSMIERIKDEIERDVELIDMKVFR